MKRILIADFGVASVWCDGPGFRAVAATLIQPAAGVVRTIPRTDSDQMASVGTTNTADKIGRRLQCDTIVVFVVLAKFEPLTECLWGDKTRTS